MAMTGGFFIKYTFEPKALGMRNAVAGVPDWRGQQPLSLF
jgi:hypothetical protein